MTCTVGISVAGAVAMCSQRLLGGVGRPLNCRCVCLQAENFRGEREMGQEKEKKSPFCLQRMHGTADFSDILLLRLGTESIGFLLLYTRGRKW